MKKILSAILAFTMVLGMSAPAFAAENTVPLNHIEPIVVEYHDPDAQPGNIISIESKPRVDGTGINVVIGNLGIDGLDSVTVSVSATDHPIAQTQTAYAFPLVGKTFKFDIPMTKCDMTYYINVKVVDGGQTQYLTRTAGLEYGDDELAAMGWGRGTYSSRAASVNAHFAKHSGDVDVNASNIVQYLGMAVNTFNDTLRNPNDYKIVAQSAKPGFEVAHKYTHKTNYRFIIYQIGLISPAFRHGI